VILVVVFWIAGLLSRTLESYLRRSSALSYNTRELIVKFFRIFVYFIAFLITLSAMGVDLTAFAVFGGALGVGIGLGLQKITANFVSGITLLLEKSIKLGDLIEVAGNTGWVRAMNIRYALMETSDGREILIPNEELTSTRVTNWTHSNEQARIEVRAILNFATDARKAITIMLESAKSHPRCITNNKDQKPLCWLREFNDAGLVFVLAFWIGDVHEGRNTPQSEVMLTILDEFRRAGIEFAQSINLSAIKK
jgi:small-conductance mechanosensitive channel